jgi:glycerol-3-phosphate dehydrogenase
LIGEGAAVGGRLRERSLDQLGADKFDLLVIGGGIVGCRTAYEAARAGLRVALVDAGDFAGATSGSSARIVHGGLRYLRRGDLRLVRAASRERNALCSRIAPHLVRPIPFVAASIGGIARGAELLVGLSIYAALGGPGWPVPRPVARGEAGRLVPPLLASGVVPRAVFYEAGADDGRLTLATAKAAARSGAVVANYLRVEALALVRGGVSRVLVSGFDAEIEVRTRAVVNATGPWLDGLRRLEDAGCDPLTRLSKGVHLVLDTREEWNAAVAVSLEEGGHLYAVPCDGPVLLGTTDDEYAEDPGGLTVSPGDIASLLDRASAVLPKTMTDPRAVLFAYAGLRVLPKGNGLTSAAPRGHLLSVGRGGMVSVGGGKLTTHRDISLDALRRLPAEVRPRRLRPDCTPLPGGSPRGPGRNEDPMLRHLLRVYGSEAEKVLSCAASLPEGLERIAPGGPDVWAQVHYAAREEWAVTVEDVVRRRTSLALRGLDSPRVREDISALLVSGRGPKTARPRPSPVNRT